MDLNCKILLNDFTTTIGDEILRYCIAPVETPFLLTLVPDSCYIFKIRDLRSFQTVQLESWENDNDPGNAIFYF